MKRLSSFLVGFVSGAALLTGVVYAATFSIELSQAQIERIQWRWNQTDPTHATYATAQLFFAAEINGKISEWQNQRNRNREQALGLPTGYFCTNVWTGLGAGAKNAVCTSLNEGSGCLPCDPSN
jgi:hypothetical protein